MGLVNTDYLRTTLKNFYDKIFNVADEKYAQKGTAITIDSELSNTSKNPLENKAIASEISDLYESRYIEFNTKEEYEAAVSGNKLKIGQIVNFLYDVGDEINNTTSGGS